MSTKWTFICNFETLSKSGTLGVFWTLQVCVHESIVILICHFQYKPKISFYLIKSWW